MIVKAMLKNESLIPEWMLCCEESRSIYNEFKDMVFDVDTEEIYEFCSTGCKFCKSNPQIIKFITIADGKYKGTGLGIDAIDIDEGSANKTN